MNSVIEVRELSKSFKVYNKESGLKSSLKSLFKREYFLLNAIDNISFSINKGEFVGLIGLNGAGKSTTLKCLTGLIEPSDGSVKVLGCTPLERKSEYLKSIAYVMGSKNQLWWDLPAIETLEFTKVVYDVSDEDFNNRLKYFYKHLDLEKISKKPVRELSLGERMKFEIVNSLIYSPEILYLDEPTLGLDIVMQSRIRDFLRDYNREYGATIVLTSHYMEDVEDLCSRVLLINNGGLIYDGTVQKLKKKYSLGKEVSFKTSDKVNIKSLEKYGKVESSDGVVKIHVSEDMVNELSSEILSKYSINDFEINSISLEKVIKKVFKN